MEHGVLFHFYTYHSSNIRAMDYNSKTLKFSILLQHMGEAKHLQPFAETARAPEKFSDFVPCVPFIFSQIWILFENWKYPEL